MMTDETTVRVIRSKGFDAFAGLYDRYARIQQIAGLRLSELLKDYVNEINGNSVVELGAGTGIVTDHLKHLFPDSDLIASDVSPAMLDVLHHKYGLSNQVRVQFIDANRSDDSLKTVKAVVCAFTIQWLDDPVHAIVDWLNTMPSGAFCFLTWPGESSFPEWKRMADASGVPFTGNLLPGSSIVDSILSFESATLIYHSVDDIQLEFDTSIDFFKSMRDIGAGLERHESIVNKNLLRLIRMWDMHDRESIIVTHRIHTLILKKL